MRVAHVQHFVALPVARVMPVRPAETPEKHVIALLVGLDGQGKRGLVGDPGERGVHHAVLKIHDSPRLGARNAEENEAVAIDGVDGVFLEGVAEHGLGQQRSGEAFLHFDRRAALVEDRGRTVRFQRAQIGLQQRVDVLLPLLPSLVARIGGLQELGNVEIATKNGETEVEKGAKHAQHPHEER